MDGSTIPYYVVEERKKLNRCIEEAPNDYEKEIYRAIRNMPVPYEKLNEILERIEALKAKRTLTEIELEQDKKLQAFVATYKNEDSAARWIDLGDRSVESLLNECIK